MLYTTALLPAAGHHTVSIRESDKRQLDLSLTAGLIMDELDRELLAVKDLEDDNDSFDDNSSKASTKSKLPLVNLDMHAGENISTKIEPIRDKLINCYYCIWRYFFYCSHIVFSTSIFWQINNIIKQLQKSQIYV